MTEQSKGKVGFMPFTKGLLIITIHTSNMYHLDQIKEINLYKTNVKTAEN